MKKQNFSLTDTIKAIQNGDNGAFATLYENYRDEIYKIALSNTRDENLAADITQETFIKIFETLSSLKDPAAFSAWAKKIAYNKCAEYYRSKTYKYEVIPETSEEILDFFDGVEEDNASFIPEASLDTKELQKTLREMLNTLPEAQRDAVFMHYFGDMPLSEIAEIQGVPVETVKSRLYYARKTLKGEVEAYEKKTGVTLHAVALFPLLEWAVDAEKIVMPLPLANNVSSKIASQSTTVQGSAQVNLTAELAKGAVKENIMKTNLTTIINSAKALISAHKVAAIVTAAAIGTGAVGAGVGVALHHSSRNKDDVKPPKDSEAITETVDATDDTTIDSELSAETEEPETEEATSELETKEPETETAEPETSESETTEPETSESVTEPETEEPTEKETEKTPETTKAPETTKKTETTPATETEPVETEPPYVDVTGISLDVYSLNLNVGESATPYVTIIPWNATEKGALWTSNSTIIADVDQNGTITATGDGECVITVRSASNADVFATINVTVTDPNASISVSTPSGEEEDLSSQIANIVQYADLTTGISWDGVSPIIYTYPDGTTGTEIMVGATYEPLPGSVMTVFEMDMPGYVAPEYDPHCKHCGKIKGDGTNGTCIRYSLVPGDHICENCGETIPEYSCHTCD